MATALTAPAVSLQFLDDVAAAFERGEVDGGMAVLFDRLCELRRTLPAEIWRDQVVAGCREHPLRRLIHQDPMTLRAFAKPRGYAGDAELLDFIYAVEDWTEPDALAEATELGRRVYAAAVRAPAAEAVRARRRIVADRIERLAARQEKADVLSLACGHLREASWCAAARERRLGRYVAVDQDAVSLAVVERQYGAYGVETVAGSVRDLLRGRLELGSFDFIYSSGLYDYLPLPVAQALTERLFAMLKPGGRLLLANFLPGIADAGYMEAYMDWWLTYRTKAELVQFTERLPEPEVAALSLSVEDRCNVGFVEVERKG